MSFWPRLLACTSLHLQYANNIDGVGIHVAECGEAHSVNGQRPHSIHTNAAGCFQKIAPGQGTAKWWCKGMGTAHR